MYFRSVKVNISFTMKKEENKKIIIKKEKKLKNLQQNNKKVFLYPLNSLIKNL